MHSRSSLKEAEKDLDGLKHQILHNIDAEINDASKAKERSSTISGGQIEAPIDEIYDRSTALPHFAIMMKFLDRYFGGQERLLQRVANATEERIAFDNLWMAFQPGSTIVCRSAEGGKTYANPALRDQKDEHTTRRRDVIQAYRVLATDGGRPLAGAHVHKASNGPRLRVQSVQNAAGQVLINTTTDEPAQIDSGRRVKDLYMSLYVYCFHIDTDGVKYDTVPEIICLTPYEDLVELRSMEAFPIRYLEIPAVKHHTTESDDIRATGPRANISSSDANPQGMQNLINRGRQFIDLTSVAHMTYDGLTVGETKEEV